MNEANKVRKKVIYTERMAARSKVLHVSGGAPGHRLEPPTSMLASVLTPVYNVRVGGLISKNHTLQQN